MPIGNSPEFNPSTIINVNNQGNLDDEEYRLFGTRSLSDSSEDLVQEVKVDDDDDHSNDDADDDDDDDEEMDDDAGTLFFALVNSEGLNFFLNNELSNSSIMIDYFHDECFGGTELSNECLLITPYVYYFCLSQSKNFTRMMKSNKWIGKLVEKKLVEIKYEIEREFGKNEDGNGHCNEIKFMMKCFSTYFPTKFKNACTMSNRPMVRFTHMNSNLELRIFPVYVLQYVRHDKNVSIEKICSCGDDGIFPNVNPCILILKDGHYYNVWDYCSLFNEIDCPMI